MSSFRLKGIIAATVAGSMMLSSTAAGAAAATSGLAQANPWAVLSAMSGGAPAVAMCGAAVAAAQAPGGCVLPALDAPPPPAPTAAAPPPPPPVEMAAGGGFNPLLLGLLAIAAGVGLALAMGGHHSHGNSPA